VYVGLFGDAAMMLSLTKQKLRVNKHIEAIDQKVDLILI